MDDNEDTLKEAVLKKIMTKRQLNASSFTVDNEKSDKHLSPFESSIIL